MVRCNRTRRYDFVLVVYRKCFQFRAKTTIYRVTEIFLIAERTYPVTILSGNTA